MVHWVRVFRLIRTSAARKKGKTSAGSIFLSSTGVVISGYRIRNNTWTEIGRMSPQLPQTFYDVTHPGIGIQEGDILVSLNVIEP